jgi:hypothetical protein
VETGENSQWDQWDRGDALGRPLAELIADFDYIARQLIPYSRLPRRWSALSDTYRHWSDLAGVTPQALLYQPKIGASALRVLAEVADDAVRAQRRSRTTTPLSPAEAAAELINRLTDFDRQLLAGLVWSPCPRRQTELAEELKVRPVSLYRNRPRAEQRCADLLADPSHQDIRAHADTLGARLGSYVPGDAADRELERLGVPPQSDAAALLLYLAGPYRQRDDWLDNAATKGHDTAAAATTALFRRHPAPTPAQLHTALTEAGLSEPGAARYVETHLQLRRFGDVVVRWNDQTVANMCEAVLHALGKPTTAATIYAHLDSTKTSASYVRQALSDDYRFTRSSRTLWALRAWNIPEYHGIAAALGSYLDDKGGHAEVETILDDFAARYPDVSPKSTLRYLDSLEFVVDRGVARRRTSGDGFPPPVGPLNAVRGVFRNGDNEIRCVRTCTEDLLRGSGQAIHAAVAQALGVTPSEHRTFHGPHGDVRVRWRTASSSGADLSSLRAYAHAIGARPGEILVIAFGVAAGTIEVRRVDAGPGTTRRLEQILGRTLRDRAAELAASLDCTREEIATVLARRGDHASLRDLIDGITAVTSPDGETAT